MQRTNRMVILLVALVAFFAVSFLVRYYTDWLWFQALDYSSLFWGMLRARFASGIIFGAIAAALVFPNIYVAGIFTRHALSLGGGPMEGQEVPGEAILKSKIGYLVAAGILVLILGNIGAQQWPVVWRYLHDQPFGVADPIFDRDVGFYVFVLPFYQFFANFVIGCLVVSAVFSGLVYAAAGGIRFQEKVEVMPKPLGHFSVIGGIFLLVMSWKYRLKVFDLLFAKGSVFSGAGYVDVNVQIWAYWLLVIVFFVTGVLVLMNARSQSRRLPMIALGVLVGGAVVIGSVPGSVVQKLIVEPSELDKEGPYLAHNIEATNRAYGLDRIEEQPFEASEDLTRADIEANPLTVRNIRIWDERPLKQTYQQIQEIRPYYVFPNVDVDRYTVDGVYRQVMLSGRELDTNRLPEQARTWQNERLQYTHGYGVAVSPVNKVTSEGLPEFMVQDIPPIWEPGLEIDQPEIYYGERSYGYAITRTSIKEFDYPQGDGNQWTYYEGAGGVSVGSFFKKLAFTIRFMDVNILLSNFLQPESRIMFRRQIQERVQTLLPFLYPFYDSDPYLVISEGRLFWIQDCYTTTNMYPYSTRSGRAGINYIRNSVKAVIDAYNGTVTFYQADAEDPIVNAYGQMFPGLLKPISEMPADLRKHVRYPIDLFRTQAARYRDYHMQEVQVFYNQEDLWEIPNEIYRDQAQMMEPYYIIIKLPGETREEFLLMVPYTPAKKDNMIAWLAARCDGDNYGDLLVYKLPKDKLIYGPMQLESRIDQQTEISSQLTLWGQRGSEVIRGNLLAIPIESSFLYVEPIYLQARREPERAPVQPGQEGEQGQQRQQQPRRQDERSTAIPELKQVIVSFAGQVLMRNTIEDGLNELFGEKRARTKGPAGGVVSTISRTAVELAAKAESHFQSVKSALQKWDWTNAGKQMEALEQTIKDLKRTVK